MLDNLVDKTNMPQRNHKKRLTVVHISRGLNSKWWASEKLVPQLVRSRKKNVGNFLLSYFSALHFIRPTTDRMVADSLWFTFQITLSLEKTFPGKPPIFLKILSKFPIKMNYHRNLVNTFLVVHCNYSSLINRELFILLP